MLILLTVREAAQRLSVAPATIYGLCAQGRLAHVRVGTSGRGTIRIHEDHLAAFIESATVTPAVPAEPKTGRHPKGCTAERSSVTVSGG